MKEMEEDEINCVCDTVNPQDRKGKNPLMWGEKCVCEAGEAMFEVAAEKIQTKVLSLEAKKKFDFNPADYWDLVAKDGPRLKDGKLEGEFVIRRKVRP